MRVAVGVDGQVVAGVLAAALRARTAASTAASTSTATARFAQRQRSGRDIFKIINGWVVLKSSK